jgi:cell division septum initiation protein DivIVA
MGVVVLIASLFRQQFHPEINAQEARAKASRLKALVRASEDQLAILDAKIASGQDHSDAMIALLTQIRGRLTEIEDPEAIDSKPSLVRK